jgi:hypothetical protein
MGLGKTYSTKYLVDSNGNTGAANQVLVSTATGVDWVDGSGSGIIGGPYLPLAGGTMTGATLHGDSVHSYWGNSNDLDIYHDNTFGSIIRDRGAGDLAIESNQAIRFRKSSTTELMTLMVPDGAVSLYYDNVKKLETTSSGVTVTGLMQASTVGVTNIVTNKVVKFNGSVLDDSNITDTGSLITLGSAVTATGTLTVAGVTTLANVGYLGDGLGSVQYTLQSSNTGYATIDFGDVADSNIGRLSYNHNDDSFLIRTNNATALTLSSAQNATFAGTVTSPTFLGDLNGTINTVTTAVTKANATNDTTVATTAFVQNLIGTIPAGLVFQGTWNAATNTPTLTSGTGTTGNFYIVSTSGSTNLDGVTDWVTGDWAVFIEQGATDAWEKIDNSSVLDGVGTGQTLPLWSGSGTSNTLTDSKLVQNTAGTLITAFTNSLSNTGTFITNSEGGGEVGLTVQSRTNRAKLRVADNDSNAYVVAEAGKAFYGTSSNGDATNITVLTSGNVGIGGTGPLSKLHVNGGNISIQNVDSSSPYTASGKLRFLGRYDRYLGGINTVNTGSYAEYDNGLDFYVQRDTFDAAGHFAMRINHLGNVGIGTISPSTKLHVAGIAQVAESGNSAFYGGNYVRVFNDQNYGFRNTGGTYIANISMSGNSYFNGGNVGIGTTSPGAKLDVNGDVFINSNYTYSSAAANDLTIGKTTTGNHGITIATGPTYTGSIYFGDSDNNDAGIIGYQHSDNSMKFTTNRSERMRITSTGNVGIGTTSPTNKLDIRQSTSGGSDVLGTGAITIGSDNPYWTFRGTATSLQDLAFDRSYAGTWYESMRIQRSTGNVGIGTASPSYKLDVNAGGIGGIRSITNVDGWVGWFENTNSSSGVVVTAGVDSGDAPLLIRKQDGTELFSVRGNGTSWFNGGNVGIGTTSPDRQLQIHESTSGTSTAKFTNSTTSEDGDTGFFVGINGSEQPILYGYNNTDMIIGTNGSERMRITSAGNVGIGTTSPTQKLDVNGNIGLSGNGTGNRWILLNETNTYAGTLRIQAGAGSAAYGGAINMYGHSHATNPGDVAVGISNGSGGSFRVNSTGIDTGTDLFIVKSSGNVGIGTTAPNYKLEVNNTSAGNLTTALTLNNGSSTTNTAVALRLQTDPTSTVNSYSEIRSTRTNSPAAGGVAMRFLVTNSTTGAASEIMRLSYAGLGLGTAGTTTITDTRRGAFADGTAAAPAYSFSDDTNNGMYRITTDTLGFSTAGSEKLRISSAGNVGIGTSNPSEKLDVNGNLIVSGNFNNLYVGGKTNSNVDGIRMLCAGDDSYIDCRGGSGLNFRLDDTTGDTQRIKFHSGGNVSIGNTNNTYKLDVQGTGNFAGNLQISTGDQATTRLLLKNTNSAGGRTFALVGGIHNVTQDGFSIYDTVAAATRLAILNTGNVGIGNNNDTYKLDVSGTGRFTSTVTATNFILSSDKTLKDNISDINTDHVDVKWKNFELKSEPGVKRAGVVAQELEEKHPEFVRTDKDGIKSVAYIDLLIAKIAELEARLEKLEK